MAEKGKSQQNVSASCAGLESSLAEARYPASNIYVYINMSFYVCIYIIHVIYSIQYIYDIYIVIYNTYICIYNVI